MVDQLVVRRHVLVRGDHLHQMGEPVRHRLYAIQSGQFKTCQLSPDGWQRITGFHFRGDLLGLDAIGLAHHRNHVIALTDAVVCEVAQQRLTAATRHSRALALRLSQLLSKELARQQAAALLLNYGGADQKLAAFLLQLWWQQGACSPPPYTLELAMSRNDIGSYLGLTDATVTRALRRLQRLGYVQTQQRTLTICHRAGLEAIAQ